MTDQGDMFGGSLEGLRRETRRLSIQSGGTVCPCCDQKVHRTKRPINCAMARILIEMRVRDRGAPGAWLNIQEMKGEMIEAGKATKDLADGPKLRHWGLIEKHPTAKGEFTKSSGLWRITDKGIQFAEGKIRLHSHCHYFNNQAAVDPKSNLVGIRWSLGKNFDYDELMRTPGEYPP